MSDIFDSIKQSADQILSNLDQEGRVKSAIEGLRTQWTEVERRRRINQLSGQVKNLQTEMKQLTEALGLQTLSLYDAGRISNVELTRLCERIDELRSEIEERRAELNDMKAEVASTATTCPHCRETIAVDAEFCPKCGERVAPKQVPPPAPASAQPKVRFRCPKCQTVVPEGAGFCPTCGVKLKMPEATQLAKQFCDGCGAEIAPGARFCPVCGQATGTGA